MKYKLSVRSEKNSNYVFFYDAADLDEVKRKNIDCQGTIEKVLSVVFEGSNVNYLVRGDEVVLKVNKQSVQQKGEKRVVTGVVTDAIDGRAVGRCEHCCERSEKWNYHGFEW